KIGAIGFAVVPMSASALEDKVATLREALEPKTDEIDELPPFDLELAHQLFTALLQPVEMAWRPAKSLIVVTNGALGRLPLALLPTALKSAKTESDLLFGAYRQVAWLARTHAVSQLPSAAALRNLRQLPPGSPKREKLIGFGDPFFSTAQ